MPQKNNVSALKKGAAEPVQTILPSNDVQSAITGEGVGRIGRPRKTRAEKRDYKVTLSLTQQEGARVAEKAGLAAEATVVYAHLKATGFFD